MVNKKMVNKKTVNKKKPLKNILLNRFLLNYNGNKYQEVKKHIVPRLKNINEYDLICEPFCGIFGFTRAILENNLSAFNGQIWLNDIDEDLIKNLKLIQSFKNEDDLKQFEDIINKYENDKELTNEKNLNWIVSNMSRFGFGLKNVHNAKRKIINYKLKIETFKKLFEKVTFFNMDAQEFMIMVKKEKNKKKLIFFDPPYFNSNNLDYHQYSEHFSENCYNDGTGMYLSIYEEYKKDNSNGLLFIMNKIDIINYLFKDYTVGEIKGVYSNTKIKNKIKYKALKWHIIYGKNLELN